VHRRRIYGGGTTLGLLLLITGTVPVTGGAAAHDQAESTTCRDAFDEAGVRAVVSKRIAGRQQFIARLSAEPFADDGIWVNAFGRRVVGRAAIETFLAGLYADPGWIGREVLEPAQISEVVFVRPDVAVVRVFQRSRGQKLPNGTTIAERRSHNTMTLTREPAGWKVRYEIVTDERDSRRP
jgi:uncharacterized protein (TIGR02246 family)